MQTLTLEQALDRLPLNVLARRLGIPGEIPDRDGKTVRCFFADRHPRGDRNPSFNFFDGRTRFKCHGCGVQGRGPDLISLVQGLDPKEAIRRFVEMAGGVVPEHQSRERKARQMKLPGDLHEGGEAEILALADLRRLDPHALALAGGMGVLRFGTVHGFPCWIVTDESRRIAEARRMDGKPFPSMGSLGERKAHTLAGSDKSWPVGLRPRHRAPESFRRIALVEGGPDLLAAYHFLLEHEVWETLPVAMLGRNCKSLHPEALALMKGLAVRAYPHADPDGGGLDAAREWLRKLHQAGSPVIGAFNLGGLVCQDGSAAKDLNDCVSLCDRDQPEIQSLFAHE